MPRPQRWGVDGDALHNMGGRLVARVVFLAAIGRL